MMTGNTEIEEAGRTQNNLAADDAAVERFGEDISPAENDTGKFSEAVAAEGEPAGNMEDTEENPAEDAAMEPLIHLIKEVEPGSIAEELELAPGDAILAVNGQAVEDIFDYQYLTNEEYLTVLVRKADGEEWELEIEKEYEEDLGITFENPLLDEYRSCRNHCIFCFIDQMPKGMRDTLYFKDDDSRLSFLQGNYVTLTNMSDHDIDRIIRYHLEPINISFQTMNPALRCKMLHNRFAGDIFPKVRRLADAGIEMNGQIVLCRGVNDGAELENSIREMTKYLPSLRSVSVVPVGLTKFRDGLYPLEPFTKEDAGEVIDCIESWQKQIYPEYGLHFIHASDEWYILAGRPFPEAERYDGYLQLENGVGMMRLLWEETMEALGRISGEKPGTAHAGCGLDTGQDSETRRVSGAEQGSEVGQMSGAGQGSEVGQMSGAEQGSEAGQMSDAEQGSEVGQMFSSEQGSEVGQMFGAGQGSEGGQMSGSEQSSEAGQMSGAEKGRELSLATGRLAAPFLRELYGKIHVRFPEVTLHIYEIRNDFFGERITVSGLITGQDLIAQLKGRQLGSELLLPCSMLRSGENVFLDDVTVVDLEKALQIKVHIVKSGGRDLVEAVTGRSVPDVSDMSEESVQPPEQ